MKKEKGLAVLYAAPLRTIIPQMYKIESPAKINLHLDIGLPREDGYHDLHSLFSMVDLVDTLCVEELPGEEHVCRIEGPFNFPMHENLIYKAYQAFSKASGFSKGIEVKVEKRIPAQAGLGGGSSNAAAILKVLNEMSTEAGPGVNTGEYRGKDRLGGYGCGGKSTEKLSPEELNKIAAGLGSDVPFFLNGPLALAAGRGERLEKLDVRDDVDTYPLVLILPNFPVSTGEAYRLLDESRTDKKRFYSLGPDQVREMYYRQPPSGWSYFNSFTPVLREHYPLFDTIFRAIGEDLPLFTEISGSGSGMFALCDKKDTAEEVIKRLKKHDIRTKERKMLASCIEPFYNKTR